jgi:putative ABC transport system permease protein
MMLSAIAVSLAAIGAVLGAFAILTREIAVNYLGTRPASATLELPNGVDSALVEEVRKRSDITEAEARDTILGRVRVGDDWRPLLLFVVDDFEHMRLNTFRSQTGAWPPPEGTMLVERTAVKMLEAGPGDAVRVKTPNGEPRDVMISGTVHDPGLAPAWQERMGYGYVTRATSAALGEPRALRELRVTVRDRPSDRNAIELTAKTVARWLGERGHTVHEIRVPLPGRHPHQLQMVTILVMLLLFAAMTLVLSAIVVATTLAAMLARQVREIGIMKTVGARTAQIAGLYVALVVGLGTTSVLVAWPCGIVLARALSGAVADLLNFDLTSTSVPAWVLATQMAAGLVVPLLITAIPIRRASRATVREAIDQHGVSADMLRPVFSRLPSPLRNALRRPARLLLTLGLLAAGGAMFMTALNVRESWTENLDKFYETRHYDLEVRLRQPEPLALVEKLRRIAGVRLAEPWGYAPSSFTRAGEVDISSSYPDGRHGALAIFAPPATTDLIRFPILAGRWLRPSDSDAVVLNHAARAQNPRVRIGGTVTLSLDGRPTVWRVVGVVEEIGGPPVAYVTDQAFARVTGTMGSARMLRIATTSSSARERTAILRSVEEALDTDSRIEQALPLTEHRTAVGDHMLILIRALVAMALVMALVGALGLASTMSVSVIERTREIGVMKTIGATPRRVMRELVAEALAIGLSSCVLAFALSLPLTAYVDRVIGNLGFLASLPFVLVPAAVAGWLGIVVVITIVATWWPARRAAAITVREALAVT